MNESFDARLRSDEAAPKPYAKWRAMLWMVGLLACVLASFMPALALFHAVVTAGGPLLDGLAGIGASLLALLGYAVAVRFVEKRPLVEIEPRRAVPELLIGVVIGTSLFATVMAILVASGAYEVTWLGPAPAWRGASISIRAGIIEEIVFRGILLRLLWSACGLRIALAVSAALFGAAHLVNPGATILSALSIALEAGVMLGAFYALTGRLWTSIGVHSAWNFAQSYLFGATVLGQKLGRALAHSVPKPDTPAWLTGGSFGPEASVVAILVCGAAGVVMLMMLARQSARSRFPPPPILADHR